MLTQPNFWKVRGFLSYILLPFSYLYIGFSRLRCCFSNTYTSSKPVICVGNFTVGGAGKTPIVIALCKYIQSHGKKVAILSRGYKGRLKGPVMVDENTHNYHDVGDEPVLLSRIAPVCVAKNRQDGLRYLESRYDIIVLDDGFQNRTIHKSLSLVVIDGNYGFGNGFVLPSGPLRNTIAFSLPKADAVCFIGNDLHKLLEKHLFKKVLNCNIINLNQSFTSSDKAYIAFAGIGFPEKFFRFLGTLGLNVVDTVSFPDHYGYIERDIKMLIKKAEDLNAKLITTEKDFVRIPVHYRSHISVLPISIAWKDDDALSALLEPYITN